MTVLGLASLEVGSRAQTRDRPLRVGLISFGDSETSGHLRETLIESLRQHGYEEGKNLQLVRGYAEGHRERMPVIADELATMNLDVVVTTCTPSTREMRRVTKTTPLVMAAASDPVGQGLIVSYGAPGGNITGVASRFEDVATKMLQLLVEAVPGASPVAVAFNPRNPVHQVFLNEMNRASVSLNLSVVPLAIATEDDVAIKLGARASRSVASLMVLPDDPFLTHLRRRFVAAAAKHGWPSFFGIDEAVEDGGLMSYGQPLSDAYARAAYYVDKIAKGSRPADLPVEQPTRFQLTVNKRTAAALRLSIPHSILLRADRVID